VLYDNEKALKLLSGLSQVERRAVGPESEHVVELPEARGIGR
jgi:hypothetical protein